MSAVTITHIDAGMVKLALVAQHHPGMTMTSRWCAMSPHYVTDQCTRRRASYLILQASTAGPMTRGHIALAIERSRLVEGAKAMPRIYGVGIKALRAEDLHIMRKAGGVA